MAESRLFMVFDVESIGLHGEGFAVGWTVVRRDGGVVASATYACDPSLANGSESGRTWVNNNVKLIFGHNCNAPRWVRDEFWRAWEYAKKQGATLWAECSWPVEANFLSACIADDPENREWSGPYPLHDVATLRLAAGMDPLKTESRRENELPVHCPQADSRQSARLLIEAFNIIESKGTT